MNASRPISVSLAARLLLAAAVIAAATGVAFASWMDHGPGIFLALVESGLAWCF
jgi:hypothetical protein